MEKKKKEIKRKLRKKKATLNVTFGYAPAFGRQCENMSMR